MKYIVRINLKKIIYIQNSPLFSYVDINGHGERDERNCPRQSSQDDQIKL